MTIFLHYHLLSSDLCKYPKSVLSSQKSLRWKERCVVDELRWYLLLQDVTSPIEPAFFGRAVFPQRDG
jgi:hypothetical protein